MVPPLLKSNIESFIKNPKKQNAFNPKNVETERFKKERERVSRAPFYVASAKAETITPLRSRNTSF